MLERTPTEKFYDHYERYQSAKSRQGAHWTKVYAMFSIGDLRQLVGENYKDKNECAKVMDLLAEASLKDIELFVDRHLVKLALGNLLFQKDSFAPEVCS
jgi:hypothetical protein